MFDWIAANWVWLLVGVGALWLLFGRRGMGCGMGGHGTHGEGTGGESHPGHARAPGSGRVARVGRGRTNARTMTAPVVPGRGRSGAPASMRGMTRAGRAG